MLFVVMVVLVWVIWVFRCLICMVVLVGFRCNSMLLVLIRVLFCMCILVMILVIWVVIGCRWLVMKVLLVLIRCWLCYYIWLFRLMLLISRSVLMRSSGMGGLFFLLFWVGLGVLFWGVFILSFLFLGVWRGFGVEVVYVVGLEVL